MAGLTRICNVATMSRIRPVSVMMLAHRSQRFAVLPRALDVQVRWNSVRATQVKAGDLLKMDGSLWVVRNVEHVKFGKGGAFSQVEVKEVKTGLKKTERLRSAESVERVTPEAGRRYTFMYREGEVMHLMDQDSFEQIEMSVDMMGDQAVFLKDNCSITVRAVDGEPVWVELTENQISLKVVQCDSPGKAPGDKIDSGKPATLENGLVIRVPSFVVQGEDVLVDVRDRSFVKRA